MSKNIYGNTTMSVSFRALDEALPATTKTGRKNLPTKAGTIVADARNDITIPFFSNVLQHADDTLIQRGGGKGLKIYDEIERDPFAYAVLQKRKKNLVAREWEVTSGGEDQIDLDAAEFIEDQLKALPFDLISEDLLDATLKGYAISEVVWKRDGKHIVPQKIITHDQRRFVFDQDWKPRLLTLHNMQDGLELPTRKFIVHRHGVKGNNPYGLGLGTRLFWATLFKREGVAYWLTFLDKFASPTVLGKTPYGMPVEMERKLLESLASIVQNAAVTVPLGTEVDFLEASSSGTVSYQDWCEYWDKQISIATLGETLTTDIQGNGSRAAGEVHADILQMLVDADGDLLSGTLRESLLQWLVDYNFPGAKVPMVWRVRASNEKEMAETSEKKANATIAQDEALRQVVATSSSFEKDEEAQAYILAMAPYDLKADMIDQLVKARHSFTHSAPSIAPEAPKKKEVKPDFAEFGDDVDTDIQNQLVEQLAIFGDDWDSHRLGDLKEVVEKASSLEEAAKDALRLYTKWKPDQFAKTLQLAMTASAFSGRDAVLSEVSGETSFADANAFSQPFQEQIDFFGQKAPRPTKDWLSITKGDHDRSFVIAGAKDRDMLADFQTAIGKAIKKGTGLRAFRKDFDTIVRKYGWSYKGERGWRTKVIFETNVRMSYMAGRLKQMRDPGVLKARPYWQYRHGQIRKPKIPRDEHLAWDGIILPADDPFWDQHFPPNGWGCSCGVRTLSERDLQRLGKTKPDSSPPTLMKPILDKKTGKLIEHPAGIDQGFDYQPGNLWERGLVPSHIEKVSGAAAFTVDAAEPISDLVANGHPFKAQILKEGKPPEFYIDAFLKVFAAKRGTAVLFKDKAGERIPISDELFRSADGSYKVGKRGRDVHAAQIAETIRDPDEIWVGIRQVLVPDEQGGGHEWVVDRKYIRIDPKTGLLAIFELLKGEWASKTAFRPSRQNSVKTDVNVIDKRRSGVLVYKKGTANTINNNDD